MLLDIGCGDRPYEDGRGWTHMDERPLPDVEIVGRIEDIHLYVELESCEEIMARHVLEHFSWRKTHWHLTEWRACLKPGGILHVEVPNLVWQAKALANGEPDPSGRKYKESELIDMIFGSQDYPGNFHKTGFTESTLNFCLLWAGFDPVTVQDVGQVLVAKAVRRDS